MQSSLIQITPTLALDERDIDLQFIRSAGPGGQNVNKVATAVQLRFDIFRAASLPPEVRHRLVALAGNRVSKDGVLILTARRFRTQERNRADAIERLAHLVKRATQVPRKRRKTKPSKAVKRRRLDAKRRAGDKKQSRSRKDWD